MPRVISFLVLLAIVLLVGVIFFQVMAQFIVPLFLACVLLVMFQPLHTRVCKRLPRYPRLAALLTTILILLVVLLPMVWLGWKAYTDCYAMLYPPTLEIVAEEGDGNAFIDGNAESLEVTASATQLTDRVFAWVEGLKDWLQKVTGREFDPAHLEKLIERGTGLVASLVLGSLQIAVGAIVGLAITVISLYYFLADGPGMIRTLMRLSPLDNKYEEQLLQRFSDISRAVVVATLLSAVVQGSLAGVGYYFALPAGAPIFLMTALTMVFALVPFVGTAIIWVPTCVWLLLFGPVLDENDVMQNSGNWPVAVGLAVYCVVFVSMSDNLIKPLVLQGRSNLHPLLALLSILGGVQVLGPVGILIGPMLVSFLQALLEMLHKELDAFAGSEGGAANVLAGAVASAMPSEAGPAALTAEPASAKPQPPPTKPSPASKHRRRKK